MPDSTASLRIILGDQLDLQTAALRGAKPGRDVIWMCECHAEATAVWSHKARIVLFLSAMRHFAAQLEQKGFEVIYHRMEDSAPGDSFASRLVEDLNRKSPEWVVLTWPGEYRVLTELEQACKESEVSVDLREDNHFLVSHAQFDEWAAGRKLLRLEDFYRRLRKQTGILMTADGEPEGGRWNLDADNRKPFPASGPKDVPAHKGAKLDAITAEVIQLVREQFPDHPGSVDDFDWPVTRRQALATLKKFVKERLAGFGPHQDAMWTGQPFLYHSLVSSSLNLKLLRPMEVIEAAVEAYRSGDAPLQSVEGFVRQVLGWREYVRGIYWLKMPDYADLNVLGAQQPLPDFYWTGETDMHCLAQTIGDTLQYGYAHHIQRLMITGLYSLLLGVRPEEIHRWYLAVYVDAIEWVELPNTLGMSQFADGGMLASKPYCASGNYIKRMSNYCKSCRFDPSKRTGEDACPFTTLYWDFLDRHQERLASNQRMRMQLNNLKRIDAGELEKIRAQAIKIRKG